MSKKGYEQVFVPGIKHSAPEDEKFIKIESLPRWVQPAFPKTTELNRIQSKLYPAAYKSAENLLICAPTGAGKTNIALLAILHTIGLHRNSDTGRIDLRAFKIVYISPMKALVSEVVGNF